MDYQDKLIQDLKRGCCAVLGTDTVYGLVASALDPKAVERLYEIKKRKPGKPYIILISAINHLEQFDVIPTQNQLKYLRKVWPGPFSVIMQCPSKKLAYLHRGKNSLAFRLPKKDELLELIYKVGPLVAPSANPEGLPPAKNISEAQHYFGNEVDFYHDDGIIERNPSNVFDFTGEVPKKIR